MKIRLAEQIRQAAERAYEAGELASNEFPAVNIEEPKLEAHGDFSTNFALVSAAVQKMPPRKIAAAVIAHLDDRAELLQRTEIAGPGFINFYLQPAAWHPVLNEIFTRDTRYGFSDIGRGQPVQVEFVSANPTGPLHVGHGRGAAVGDTVANILTACGYDVQKEYYINDSGRQIRTLGRSVYLRYRELQGDPVDFPADCYQGDYIRDIAASIRTTHGEELMHRDAEAAVAVCARWAADVILAGIRSDLEAFGVVYDRWFSEQSLFDADIVEASLAEFQDQGLVYEKDDALWFRTTAYGDEKDRVVVRSNGQTTYFASDIAYHRDKYRRGFERVIDVWGADHHGYIARMQAAVQACGRRPDQLHVILVQLVNLLRAGVPAAMSTRAGEFVTLRDVVAEVGADAARFLFLTRHYDSPLDFDLELAKQQTNENPVYYVQYVHARISSILRKAAERGFGRVGFDPQTVAGLLEPEEIGLIKALGRYPETVTAGAENLEPHRITFYLMALASAFHAYYNRHRVLGDDPATTRGRLCLVEAVRKVIRNGLTLLGVSAPERM